MNVLLYMYVVAGQRGIEDDRTRVVRKRRFGPNSDK